MALGAVKRGLEQADRGKLIMACGTVQTFTHELRYPATTDPARRAVGMGKRHDPGHMSVVFSTYHSIET